MDLFNPFIVELSVTTPTREVIPGDGNQKAEDLTQFPVVIVTPPSPIQVLATVTLVAIPPHIHIKY
jgi:hypothetical protein